MLIFISHDLVDLLRLLENELKLFIDVISDVLAFLVVMFDLFDIV